MATTDMSTELVVLILISKIPIYLYVIHKAFKYRNSLILISANWFGALAFFGAISSLTVAFGNKTLAGIIAYGVVYSLFMVTYTAKGFKEK